MPAWKIKFSTKPVGIVVDKLVAAVYRAVLMPFSAFW
jgi:hypothetical protein